MKCTIRFNDNANGIYYAGQTMSGTVELYLPETKKCRGFCLTIEGAAKCKWSEQRGSGKSSYTVILRGKEQFLNSISYLFGSPDGESQKIEAGVHTYNFSCFLPHELPYSVEAAYGSIRYKVDANLDIPWGIDEKGVQEFTVCRYDDLNYYPDLKVPCQGEDMKTFCCMFCESDPLMFEVSIPYSGYTPGAAIDVAVKINNKTTTTVPRCQIELVKNTLYTSDDCHTKHVSEVMVTMNAEGVEKRSTANFIKQLVIPSILTNTNATHCKVFKITYELKVICKTPGCTISPKIKFPITLGTVPLAFGGHFQPNMTMQQLPNMTMPQLPNMAMPPLPNMVPTAPVYMHPPSFEQSMNISQNGLVAGKHIEFIAPTYLV